MEANLKNGQPYDIRQARVEDAQSLLDYVNQIAGESDNLTFGPGEFNMTLEDEAAFLDQAVNADNQVVFLAVHQDRVIGNLSFRAGGRPRIAHTGFFGISVLKDYWGNGVGKALLESLINWAKDGGIVKKIDLEVRDDNEAAIKLYKKLGFQEEGHISRKFCIEGVYYSTYYMGLELD